MAPFAGIIRTDGQAVPEPWIEALLARYRGRRGGRAPRLVRDGAAAFVSLDRRGASPDESDLLVLRDARLDGPAERDADAYLVDACRRWGDGCAERLHGEFAIAAWSPGSRRLWLARDPLGHRTIHHAQAPGVFAFASDLPTLLALPFVARRLNEERIADFLRGDPSGDPAATFHADVRVLPSAHVLTLDDGAVALRRYWRPGAVPAVAFRTDDEYADALRERVVSAVESQLRDARTPAIHLSGGLDSSSLACIAARALRRDGRRLLAFSVMLPPGHAGPESDERRYVEAVLAQEGNIDVVWLEPPLAIDPFGAHERFFDALGEPPLSSVSHAEALLGEAARARGVDVVLSGFAGDLFASFRMRDPVFQIARGGRVLRAARELMAMRRAQPIPWARLIRREIVRPLVPDAVRARRAARAGGTCIHPALAARVDDRRGRPAPLAPMEATRTPRALMEFVLEPGRFDYAVAGLVGAFAREFDQSIRFPLLDRRVVELMLGVPPQHHHRDGWGRAVMRRAMHGIVPEVVRTRRDKGGAFDPAIMSRLAHARDAIVAWVADSARRDAACWRYVDRERFVAELARVAPAERDRWRPGTFQVLLLGAMLARFVDWHERTHAAAPGAP